MASDDARTRAIDELYGVPPDAFTARRDALAKALRDAGDAEGAADLKARRRPTKTAYVLNQLARREADAIAELVDVGRELARAQRRAIRGQAGPDELRAAITRQREVVASLVARARAAAKDLGIDPATVLDDVAGALRTAMTDPAAGAELEEGHLAKPPEIAVGLPSGDLLVSELAASPEPRRGNRAKEREESEAKERDAREREAEARKAREEQENAEEQRRAAVEAKGREADELREAAERARAAADLARHAADEAAARAEDAERDARAAETRADRAARDARRLAARATPRRARSAHATSRRTRPSRRRTSRTRARA